MAADGFYSSGKRSFPMPYDSRQYLERLLASIEPEAFDGRAFEEPEDYEYRLAVATKIGRGQEAMRQQILVNRGMAVLALGKGARRV